MADFRISAGKAAEKERGESHSLVEALIRSADEVAERYGQMAANLPYRDFTDQLLEADVAGLTREVAAATWKRIADEVPGYGFAERVGQRYREAALPLGALLLHWQLLRRAIHLTLASTHSRTAQGSEDSLRQASIMNYILDWAVEAALVGYVIQPKGEVGPDQ